MQRCAEVLLLSGACALAGVLASGCGDPPAPMSDPSEAASGMTESGQGSAGATCVGTEMVIAKRVVRLSEHQLFNAYSSLFGASAARIITQHEAVPSVGEREFPPISGDVGISEALFGRIDRLAQAAMHFVSDHAAELTPCGAVPSDEACVREYLLSFAERAFRHPLSDAERKAITGQLWDEMKSTGATPTELLGFGIYAITSSPSFLYRTEFGDDVAEDGPLTPHELATALSFFLTDRPPDAELLAAAAANELVTREQIGAHVARLLATPEARRNLESALIEYFSLSDAAKVILNPEATPGLAVTRGLQASILREGELFLENLLWSGPLGSLLTSRHTWTNTQVATRIYGVAAPEQVDADGFGLVELSADRSGLLTLSTFLLSGARSTGSSPVARGLAINGAVVCGVNPPFPVERNPSTGALEAAPAVAAAIASGAEQSELERAASRAAKPECAGCHQQFDAFGMVLEPYDAVGRLRTTDLEGRPIDASWTTATLPEAAGGATVASAAEAAQALVASGAFERCLTMNLINFALTEVSRGGANNTQLGRAPQTGSCAVRGVMEKFATTDRSFAELLREIASSDTFTVRLRGQ